MTIRMNTGARQYGLKKDISFLYVKMLGESHEWSKEKALALKKKVQSEGVHSSYVYWFLAYVFDHIAELELAFEAICEAIRLDPFHHLVHKCFEYSLGKLLHKVELEECDPDNPLIPRIYEGLVVVFERVCGNTTATWR